VSKQFESMMQGLTELLEYAKGDKTKCRIRIVELPDCEETLLKPHNEEIRNLD